MRAHTTSLAALAAALVLSLGTASAAEKHFQIEDYLALDAISAIAASPDGAYVAYTLSSKDLEADEYIDSVWIQSTEGGESLRISESDSNSSAPQWSSDGRYLAVLSDRKDDTTQIWLYDRRGGDAQQLTELPQGVDEFEWAPDGQRLLFVAEDPTPADLDEEAPPNPRPYVVDRLQFKEDYVGYLDRYRTHLYVVALADRKSRQVTFGDYEDAQPAWAPDSRRIAFVSNRTADPDGNRNTDIWVIDTTRDGAEPKRISSAESSEAYPAWSPDGRSIACTSTMPGTLPIYAIPRLVIVDLESVDMESGDMRHVQSLAETQVFGPQFSPDGASILAITENRGEQNLVRVDARTGAVQALVEGEDVVREFAAGANGQLFVLVARPQWPAELYALDGSELRRLSEVQAAVLEGIELARVEKYAYQSADGTPMDTFVAFPPGYRDGKSYPGILYIHGGPQAQFDYGFDVEAQLLAARGFVVVMPNPRGSFGYGQAFAKAIYRDWGGIDYQDVIAAMDFAIEEGWVDEDRMAVYGWSYGGMMTNHVITKTDRFDAAITGASATLYVANYGHDQYQRWWEEELGLPWLEENRENWQKISPFYSLDKVKTPTLIVGGENDWNVPILNSEQLYIALKRQGVPTELVIYPNEGHILSVPSYERDLYERYFAWLDRYVDGKRR
jgi:dipeptidyl aminopeptidase/acylaminoacyl peptidase